MNHHQDTTMQNMPSSSDRDSATKGFMRTMCVALTLLGCSFMTACGGGSGAHGACNDDVQGLPEIITFGVEGRLHANGVVRIVDGGGSIIDTDGDGNLTFIIDGAPADDRGVVHYSPQLTIRSSSATAAPAEVYQFGIVSQ